ncbi:hypothetical protein CWE14_03605 [Aliidiomarina soli]|uniref:Uncharacterized protein n=1 Tax=Aliidiomarina soli TaxID=1928574 RepID=A0A432WMS3_9GAMM|nr:hypothetical protein CWE14_03605 [Aliidiomarina soli]
MHAPADWIKGREPYGFLKYLKLYFWRQWYTVKSVIKKRGGILSDWLGANKPYLCAVRNLMLARLVS